MKNRKWINLATHDQAHMHLCNQLNDHEHGHGHGHGHGHDRGDGDDGHCLVTSSGYSQIWALPRLV